MDRRIALQSVHPLAPGSSAGLPPLHGEVSPRGFSSLTDLDDGQIPGDPSPSCPKGEPRKQHNQREALERLFAEQKLNLDELSPYRVRTAWRAIRWMAVKLGICHEEMLLGELPEEAKDPLNGIDTFFRPNSPDRLSPPHPDRATRRLMEIVRKSAEIGEKTAFSALSETENAVVIREESGFSLLPSPENAVFWCQAVDVASEYLFLRRGSVKDPDQGRYGMMGLTDPDLAPLACPILPEIYLWELFLVDEAVKLLASTGEHIIDTMFRDYYGLLPDETRPIFAQARKVIRDRVSFDVEEQRAMMILRIQDVIGRAQEAIDPRAELMGLKLLSQTVGITRAEPEDLKSMFKKIVSTVNKEKRQIDYSQPVHTKMIESTSMEPDDA